jgi:hypothetical protein
VGEAPASDPSAFPGAIAQPPIVSTQQPPAQSREHGLLPALLLSVLIAAGAWLLARLAGDFFDGLDDGRHGWQRALQGRLGAEEDQDRLPDSLWLRRLAALSRGELPPKTSQLLHILSDLQSMSF